MERKSPLRRRSKSKSSSGEYIEMQELQTPTPLSLLFTNPKYRNTLSEINKYFTEQDIATQKQVSKKFHSAYGGSSSEYESRSSVYGGKKVKKMVDLVDAYVDIWNQNKSGKLDREFLKKVGRANEKYRSHFETLSENEINFLPDDVKQFLKQSQLIPRSGRSPPYKGKQIYRRKRSPSRK